MNFYSVNQIAFVTTATFLLATGITARIADQSESIATKLFAYSVSCFWGGLSSAAFIAWSNGQAETAKKYFEIIHKEAYAAIKAITQISAALLICYVVYNLRSNTHSITNE